MSLETSEGLLEAMGSQALTDASYQSPEEISKKIDNISLTDVANVRLCFLSVLCRSVKVACKLSSSSFFQAAKTFVSGKKTMASSGNLVKTPFVDEI